MTNEGTRRRLQPVLRSAALRLPGLRPTGRRSGLAIALAAAAIIACGPALAQSKGKPAAGDELSLLRQRVDQLEEQMVDLQVVIGTLESLARAPQGGSTGLAASAAVAGDDPRVSALETQVRALTVQVEQMSRSGAAPAAPVGDPQFRAPVYTEPGRRSEAPAVPNFGATTITSNAGPSGDPIGRYLSNNAAAPPAASGFSATAKEQYETAYGYLLQQNYGAAETAFTDFLVQHPRDELAGNAQYWLGEVHYVQGNYKSAASAFLKGYQAHQGSVKAPDSLLKLAMSLDRLGERDAACSSFQELEGRFPNAPDHVKRRGASERRRLGC